MTFPKLINWSLAKNPVNWIIVVLMILIAGFGLDILLKAWKGPAANTEVN